MTVHALRPALSYQPTYPTLSITLQSKIFQFSPLSLLTFFSVDSSPHPNLSTLKAPSPTQNFLSFSTFFNLTFLLPHNIAHQARFGPRLSPGRHRTASQLR